MNKDQKTQTTKTQTTNNSADGYYGEDADLGEELNLDFLDEK